MWARTWSAFSLSTSRPRLSAEAGVSRRPVRDQPRRSTCQRPGGGDQSSVPSARRRSVRSSTPVAGIPAPLSGVATAS